MALFLIITMSKKKYIFLIYADNYIVWNDEKQDFNHNDTYKGTFLDAHQYARNKYGKYYTLHKKQLNKMPKTYKIEITETLQKQIEIEANSPVDASIKAQEQWNEDKIILDSEDFVNVEIKVIKQ